jgi:Zn-dependent peptidase ImmA (M78 family)/transcriptional regulator with XRE-family HTH domain
MGAEAIATNLRRLRAAQGLTQEQAAESAGISKSAYRNIEGRRSVPRVDTLHRLAEALEVPIQELVTPAPELRRVRFRSSRRLRTREQILVAVGRWLTDFNELEDLLGERIPYALANGKGAAARRAAASPARAAAQARERLGLDPGEPVRDICGLLEARGVKVYPLRVASDAFFGLSVAAADGGPAIAVNTWERISVERWIFTAAHELAHLLLHGADYDVSKRDEEQRQEKEANVFASYFLMPPEVFAKEWAETYGMGFVDRVLKVKRIFRVSYRTVLYRLSDSLPGPELWKRFQLDYRARTGRTLLKEDEPEALAADEFRASFPEHSRAGEPEDLSPLDFVEDRLSRLVRKAVEGEEISLARGAEILGLSLGEMRQLAGSWVG